MQVLGYSERGVINSFFYEMAYTHKVAFQDFLNLIQPMINTNEQSEASKFPEFELKTDTEPTIIIEPSFSEFGDADAVILFEDKIIGNTVLFIEAKVCAEKPWDFEKDVLGKFSKAIAEIDEKGTSLSANDIPKKYSSNLLTQLYHKFGTMCKLSYNVENNEKAKLGLSPKFSNDNWKRSIGENETVLEIINSIKSFAGCMKTYYIGIIPSFPNKPLPSFSTAIKVDSSFTCFQKRLGYITWQNIYDNIVKNKMPNTDKVFKLNQAAGKVRTKNQIYNP